MVTQSAISFSCTHLVRFSSLGNRSADLQDLLSEQTGCFYPVLTTHLLLQLHTENTRRVPAAEIDLNSATQEAMVKAAGLDAVNVEFENLKQQLGSVAGTDDIIGINHFNIWAQVVSVKI